MELTQELLKEYLHYDPETGIFTWKKKTAYNTSKMEIGGKAGRNCRGYIYIGLFKKEYRAHRLAWLYVYGTLPKNNIDHINGDKSDNRIFNLRDVTQRLNNQNFAIHRGGRLPGTCFIKDKNKWRARVDIKEQKIHIGYYGTEKEAHEAYMEYLRVHNLF